MSRLTPEGEYTNDTQPIEMVDDELESLRTALTATAKQVEELRAENGRLRGALHRDKTGLAEALGKVHDIAKSYSWAVDGRGPYEWNDEKYRGEMSKLILEVKVAAVDGLRKSGDLADKSLSPAAEGKPEGR